jgi:glutathione S-transferase
VSQIKFEYFGIAGAGEKVRLALACTGTPFEDVRIAFPQWGGPGGRKETAKYGQLPIMTLTDGQEIYQSDAMLRYAGALGDGNLYPSEPMQRLKIDEALGLCGDLARDWTPALYMGMRPEAFGYTDLTPEAKDELVKSMRTKFLEEKLPKFAQWITDMVKSSGGPFLCGSALSIADLDLLPRIQYYSKGVADHVPKDSLDAYPELQAWVKAVEEEPRIKAYYESKA